MKRVIRYMSERLPTKGMVVLSGAGAVLISPVVIFVPEPPASVLAGTLYVALLCGYALYLVGNHR